MGFIRHTDVKYYFLPNLFYLNSYWLEMLNVDHIPNDSSIYQLLEKDQLHLFNQKHISVL